VHPVSHRKTHLSYERYRELAEELCLPLESRMPLSIKVEIYLSKIVYLRNLLSQCMRSVNVPSDKPCFTTHDLAYIQNAFNITRDFLRESILLQVESSIQIAQRHYHPQNAASLPIESSKKENEA
jgi:hypothetical protein